MASVRLLFVHQAFPSQYAQLAHHLAGRADWEVVAIGDAAYKSTKTGELAGRVRVRYYEAPLRSPVGLSPDAFYPAYLEWRFAQGRAAARCVEELRDSGFTPDVVMAHPSWGEASFLKDVLPQAKLLIYCEWFRKQDTPLFDPEFPDADHDWPRKAFNVPVIAALEASDWGVAPTRWQRAQFPHRYHERISVIHDGVDTDVVSPGESPGDEIVTYAARNLEPYRGFHIFMRAIPEIQRRRPKARIVIVGSDDISYSAAPPAGMTYREMMLTEMAGKIDLSRVQFIKWLPYEDYLALLRRSSVHVYFTYPFVLSWSLIEAMAAGCLVVASRTPPVEEVITDGVNGLLTDFFDTGELAAKVDEALHRQDELRPVREAARHAAITRYDLKRVCLPAQLELIEALVQGRRPLLMDAA